MVRVILINLVIKGRIPSKKNSRNLFVRGGKLMNIPSKKYAEWHKDALNQLKDFAPLCWDKIPAIKLEFYAPDKRASDLTNKAESIMDLLVDKCIISDDNWWVVGRIILVFKGVDKTNPRCEITIHTSEQSHGPLR